MDLLEKEWFIQAPWGRICIVAWGNCLNPPVLLCHGAIDSAAGFRPLMKYLPDQFYYVCMEHPGNGNSDPFPGGMPINMFDLVYPMRVVVKHFRWEKFIFMAHSLGTMVGKLYNLCYPGMMTKVIEFDPTSVYDNTTPENFAGWYTKYYGDYIAKYNKYNSPKERGPIYSREVALKKLRKNRGLPLEAANQILDRNSEPAGDGLIRFKFDQRYKSITHPPFSPSQLKKLYTNIQTPTLSIFASVTVNIGFYDATPFALDTSYYNGSYKTVIVEGNHDVHVIHPERVAPYVVSFLLDKDFKSKL